MNNRRKFLKQLSGLAALMGLPTAGIAASDFIAQGDTNKKKGAKKGKTQRKLGAPMIVTTWNFGLQANEAAWPTLSSGGRALDAIEQGIRQCENDPTERSVGYGGRPDRDGHVTLDACIMDEKGNIGSVVCMEHIANPISVARAVMEKTPHVMLAGEGATQFAVEQGFEKVNLLVPDSEREWKEWLKKALPWIKATIWFLVILGVGYQFWKILHAEALLSADKNRSPESILWEQFTSIPLKNLLISSILYILGIGLSACYWHILLRLQGEKLSLANSARCYYLSQLGKYVPGKGLALFLRVSTAMESAVPASTAAIAAGRSRWQITRDHILPNISSVLIVQITIQFAMAILAEAALSYLGLGTQPPQPSWGRMLSEAQTLIFQAPWLAIYPGLAIALSVLGLNLMGDGLRDLLDPRLSRRR